MKHQLVQTVKKRVTDYSFLFSYQSAYRKVDTTQTPSKIHANKLKMAKVKF